MPSGVAVVAGAGAGAGPLPVDAYVAAASDILYTLVKVKCKQLCKYSTTFCTDLRPGRSVLGLHVLCICFGPDMDHMQCNCYNNLSCMSVCMQARAKESYAVCLDGTASR